MKKVVVVAAVAICGSVFAGTFTWKGSGTSFSDCFNEGIPPANDPSVVLDFSGATAEWSVENDIENLKVNRIVGATVKGTITGEKPIAFAANAGVSAVYESKVNADNVSCPVVLETDLTMNHLNGAVVNLNGLVSGTGRLIVRRNPDSTNATQPATALKHTNNTFSGGVVVSAARCYAYDGSFGSGPLWSTNTVTTKYGSTTIRSEFYQYAPSTINGDLYLEKEDYNGWASHFFVGKSGTGGAVVFNGKLHSNKSKIQVDGASCPLHLKGGIECANTLVFVANQSEIFIDAPVNCPDAVFWNGSQYHPVAFTCTGNVLKGFCGWASGLFRLDVDNAFSAPYPNFAPQSTSGNPPIVIDLNGTTQVLGGHQDTSGASAHLVSPMYLKNSAAKPATVTITQSQNNLSSALQFQGNGIHLVKDGPAALMLTNAVSDAALLSVTVADGTLGVSDGVEKTIFGTPTIGADGVTRLPHVTGHVLGKSVTLAGGTLDLGGKDWVTETLVVSGGAQQNGTIRDLSPALSATGGWIGTLASDLVKTGSGDLAVGEVADAVTVPSGYRLPEGTIAYYPFENASTLFVDYGGGNPMVSENGTVTYDANGAAGGCGYFNGNAALKLSQFPAHFLATNSYTISWWVRFEYDKFRERIHTGNTEWGMVGFGDTTGSDTGNNQTWACFTLKNTGSTSRVYTDEELPTMAGFYTYGGARYSKVPFNATSWNVVTNGEWHMMTLTCSLASPTSATRTWYVDGVQRSQSTGDYKYTVPNAANPVFYFGCGMWGSRFCGWMDELLILDHAMSAVDVSALYAAKAPESVPEESRGVRVNVQAGTLSSTDSIAALYHFDDASDLGKDTVGHGTDLVTGAGAPTYADGVSPFGTGGSAYFDGSAYLKAPAYPDHFPRVIHPFSFGCFVRYDTSDPANLTREHGWMHLGKNGHYCGISMARLKAGGGIVYWNDFNIYPNYGSITDGNWHHTVTTWDGKRMAFYLDGSMLAESQATAGQLSELNLTPQDFFVGRAVNAYYFRGWIDEAAVFTRALSPAEVLSWKNNGLTLETSFPPSVDLSIASGATVDLRGFSETFGSVDNAGTFNVSALTLTDVWNFIGTLNGDLSLADGVTVEPADPAPVVNGKVTVLGGGTLALPAVPAALPTTVILATGVTAVEGAENFRTWTVPGLSAGTYVIRLALRDGVLTATVRPRGLTVIVR